MECTEQASSRIFYQFQNIGNLQFVKMLCPLKNIIIPKVIKWARLTI